jgi:hypothetical protein
MKKIYLSLLLVYLSFLSFGQTDATFLDQKTQLKSGDSQFLTQSVIKSSVVDLGNQIIYNFSGKIDTFTVPSNVSKIKITTIGAAGGIDASSAFPGGLGALVYGEFDVIPGDKLKLLVGETPVRNGGGGGSFVSDLLNNPIIIAGGGGGSGILDSPEKHGSVTETGGKGGGTGGDGGIDGNGGLANGTSYQSGAGGGFYTNGGNGSSPMIGGIAFANGGTHLSVGYGDGGFGGGGTGSGYVVGGGGGGFSGGGAAGNGTGGGVGGGGASFNSGLNKNFIAQHNSGHGQIIIELIESNPCPDDIIVDNDSASCGAVVDFTVTAPLKGSVVQTGGLPSGTEFPIGTITNTFELTDSLGVETTCSFTVTVNDTEAPVVDCPEDIVVYNDPGELCAVVQLPDLGIITGGEAETGITLPNAPTNQGGVAFNPEKNLYYAVQAGSSGYILYTYDETGTQLAANTAGFDFRGLWWNPNNSSLEGNSYNGNGYRIVDLDANGYALSTGTNNPASNYQPDSQSQADYDYDLDEVIYYDNNSIYRTSRATGALIGSSIGITGLPANTLNSTFVGYTGIPGEEVLIYDYSNKAVYFVDKATGIYSRSVQLPSSAPGRDYLNTSYANGHIWISDGTVWRSYKILQSGVADNCGVASATYDYPSGTCFPIGTTEVTLTAKDNSGNEFVCSFNVVVKNLENAPVVVANPIEVYLDENGIYYLTRKDLDEMADGTTDDATPFNNLKLTAYPHIFRCNQIGEIIHTRLSVEDAEGNVSRAWTEVTVLDTIAPMAVCRNIDVYLDENGEAIITPDQVFDPTSFDACGIESTTLEKDTFSCADLGENMVKLMVTDLSGNMSSCTAMVTVHDTLPPMPVEVADVLVEVEPGVCETLVEYPVDVVKDNCGVVLQQTAGLGPNGLFPIGTTVETWVATDNDGNMAEISFNVTVTAGNALPTIDAIGNVSANEDAPALTVQLSGITYGVDCIEQEVSVTAEAGNSELIASVAVEYSGNETGSLIITLAPDMTGTSVVSVKVEDSEGGSVIQSFTLTVNPVNDPPFVVYPIADQVVNASYIMKLPVSPDLGILFNDPDGDELTLSAMLENGNPIPAWAQIVGDTLVLNPMIADTGCYQIVVKATDPSGAFANNTFKLCVDGYPVSSPLVDGYSFDVKMYPNPTKDMVYLDVNNLEGISDLAVYSITGQEVLRRNFYQNKNISFSMSDYVSGIYLVKINTEGKQIIKKLVVDKH